MNCHKKNNEVEANQRSITNYQSSEMILTEYLMKDVNTGEGNRSNEAVLDLAESYNTIMYNIALITNIQRTIQNILGHSVRNYEEEKEKGVYQHSALYDYQALLYILAYQEQLRNLSISQESQQFSHHKYPGIYFDINREMWSQDYRGPEQSEPLDLSQKKSLYDSKTNNIFNEKINNESLSICNDKFIKDNLTIQYSSLNNNEYKATAMKNTMKFKVTKHNISRQIIEYNWKEKKNVQRRRFKMRKCQRNSASDNPPIIDEQKRRVKSNKGYHLLESFNAKAKSKRKVDKTNIIEGQSENKKLKISQKESDEKDAIAMNIEEHFNQSNIVPEDMIHNVSLVNTKLQDGLRILLRQEGVLYPGTVSAIAPPDIYGVKISRRRGNKPVILAREQLLSQGILDKSPVALSNVEPGSRVCAWWSSKYSCLYPGTVVGFQGEEVTILFDDGDCRDCDISQVRYIPQHDKPQDEDSSNHRASPMQLSNQGLGFVKQSLDRGISEGGGIMSGDQGSMKKRSSNKKL